MGSFWNQPYVLPDWEETFEEDRALLFDGQRQRQSSSKHFNSSKSVLFFRPAEAATPKCVKEDRRPDQKD